MEAWGHTVMGVADQCPGLLWVLQVLNYLKPFLTRSHVHGCCLYVQTGICYGQGQKLEWKIKQTMICWLLRLTFPFVNLKQYWTDVCPEMLKGAVVLKRIWRLLWNNRLRKQFFRQVWKVLFDIDVCVFKCLCASVHHSVSLASNLRGPCF